MPTLAEVEREALACTRCPLHRGRTNVVFGVGNPTAGLMFVGEGPGQQEDLQGEPFVGRSGQFLDRLVFEEMGLTRADCYIANVVKCRPPNNRDPLPEEIEACGPYLASQLALIDPKVIVTLGNFATKLLLQTTDGITKVRGRAYPVGGRTLVPTYHPAAVLRGGGETEAQMRADLVRAKQLLMRNSPPTAPTAPSATTATATAAPAAAPAPGLLRMIEARTKSVDDTRALAAELAPFARPGDLILLEGGLGTGKTAFVQGFAKGLGVTERVTSPTFVLVRTYPGRMPLVHLDVYRLDHLQELVDLGIAELLDEDGVTLIEWGDVVTPALPADFLEVRLEPGEGEDERRLRVRAVGPSWPPRLRAVGDALARWSQVAGA